MVTAIIIIEMMGRPPEHLKKNMESHIDKLGSEKGLTIINKTFSEPKEVPTDNENKDNQGLFTCFTEVEFECESLEKLANIMFDFMPASIEVVEPSSLSLSSDETTSFMNNLTGRLHRYDDVVKIMQNQGIQMQQKFKIAQKLLYAHGIIDKEGKILKIPNSLKNKETKDKKEDDKIETKEEENKETKEDKKEKDSKKSKKDKKSNKKKTKSS